jgi:hypothetical protein
MKLPVQFGHSKKEIKGDMFTFKGVYEQAFSLFNLKVNQDKLNIINGRECYVK